MVLAFFHAYRIIFELVSCTAFVLSNIALYRDKHCFSLALKADIVFRKAAWLTSLGEVILNVDFFGVFGLYPAWVRVFFKAYVFVWLAWGLLTYFYHAAKSCFPFVFEHNVYVATTTLRRFLIFVHIYINAADIINNTTPTRGLLAVSTMSLGIIGSTILVASYVLYFRLQHNMASQSPTSKEWETRCRAASRRWRNFTVVFSVALLIDIEQQFATFAAVARNDAALFLPLDARFFVAPDRITPIVWSEAPLRVAVATGVYMFLVRAWIPRGGLEAATSSAATTGGSLARDSQAGGGQKGGGSSGGSSFSSSGGGGGSRYTKTGSTMLQSHSDVHTLSGGHVSISPRPLSPSVVVAARKGGGSSVFSFHRTALQASGSGNNSGSGYSGSGNNSGDSISDSAPPLPSPSAAVPGADAPSAAAANVSISISQDHRACQEV